MSILKNPGQRCLLIDVTALRREFPLIDSLSGSLVYLDNAATTQKPGIVIDSMAEYYRYGNANIHRGAYPLSRQSARIYQDSKDRIKEFMGADKNWELVLTKNATESINLVARSFCDVFLKKGGSIITTELEHHSNYLPWLCACHRKEAELRILPVDGNGMLDISSLESLIDEGTAMVAVTGAANSIGCLTPLDEIIGIAHKHNVPVLVDGAQLVSHSEINVSLLDCDFFVFSSHKIYGPDGTGVLLGKDIWLEKMPPDDYGGGMVDVAGDHITSSVWQPAPIRFEAGTHDVSGIVGLAAALKYISGHGASRLHEYERSLTEYALDRISHIEGIAVAGKGIPRIPIISFTSSVLSPYDIGMLLSAYGIAVRSGTLCAQPLMRKLRLRSGLVRLSIAFYNTKGEIDVFCDALEAIQTHYLSK